eukprot:scaffold3656_cov254-Pinguiococcus_pyrenoidosus.AAC.5
MKLLKHQGSGVRTPYRRCGRCKMHRSSSRGSEHCHNGSRRRATHDAVVDQEDSAASDYAAHGRKLLAHSRRTRCLEDALAAVAGRAVALTTRGGSRHDERSCNVPRLRQPLFVRHAHDARARQRTYARSLGNRHHNVNDAVLVRSIRIGRAIAFR